MCSELKHALEEPIWKNHEIGATYSMSDQDGTIHHDWKIAYYPLFGTYKGEGDNKHWVDFDEPRALVERPFYDKKGNKGIDFREVPLYYLTKNN